MAHSTLYHNVEARRCGNSSFLDIKKQLLKNSLKDFTSTLDNGFQPVDYGKQVTAMDVDPKGRLLITGGRSGKVFFHDLRNYKGTPGFTCKLKSKLDIPPVKGSSGRCYPSHLSYLQWFPSDSGLFVCSTHDGFVRIYDTEHQEEVDTYEMGSFIFQHQMNQTQPNLIAVTNEANKLSVIDMKSGNFTHVLNNHRKFILSCCWSPSESNILATAGEDAVIRLWDIRWPKDCFYINSEDSGIQHIINGITFTVDGRSLVAISEGNKLHHIDLVSSSKPKCINLGSLSSWAPKTIIPLVVGYVGFNICIAPYMNKLRIYSLEEEERVKTLSGHFDDVHCVSFFKDRMEMYSGGKDQNLLFWRMSSQLFDQKNLF